LVEIRDLGMKIGRLEIMSLTFEEVSNAAVDIVELLFKQDEHCGFRKLITDITTFCSTGENCKGSNVLGNL
jgi:hypothetical protein